MRKPELSGSSAPFQVADLNFGAMAGSDWVRLPQVCPRAKGQDRFMVEPDAELSSLRLDVCSPDNLGPLLGFVGDELPELGGRTRESFGAQIGEPRP